MISHEHTMEHSGPHVALRVVLGSFGRLLPEYAFSDRVQLHAEVTASSSRPGCLAVLSSMHHVEQQGSMLEEPRGERVVRWDASANSSLEAQPE